MCVVSGGGSAAADPGDSLSSPAVPASVTPFRNRRRLNGLAWWILMGTFLPEARQYDTENAIQRTRLPSHEQEQHLTLRLRRVQKRERSGRFWPSLAAAC
jgi:hypothetical protein